MPRPNLAQIKDSRPRYPFLFVEVEAACDSNLNSGVIQMRISNVTVHELVFNPNHAGYGDHERARLNDFLTYCKKGAVEGWTCKKTAKPGDVCLFWFCSPVKELAGIGVCASKAEEKVNGYWDWTDAPIVWFCEYKPLICLASPVALSDIESDRVLAKWWLGRPFYGRPKAIHDVNVASRWVELILEKNPKDRGLVRILGQFK